MFEGILERRQEEGQVQGGRRSGQQRPRPPETLEAADPATAGHPSAPAAGAAPAAPAAAAGRRGRRVHLAAGCGQHGGLPEACAADGGAAAAAEADHHQEEREGESGHEDRRRHRQQRGRHAHLHRQHPPARLHRQEQTDEGIISNGMGIEHDPFVDFPVEWALLALGYTQPLQQFPSHLGSCTLNIPGMGHSQILIPINYMYFVTLLFKTNVVSLKFVPFI